MLWVLFLLCALLAEIIGTMAGFGAATLLTPMAVFLMDVKIAIALVAWFHLLGNASRLIFFGRFIRWKVWTQFGLVAILSSALGAHLTAQLPSSVLVLCLGGFLMIYVAAEILLPGKIRLPQTPMTLIGGGIVSGFISGLMGTGGAIRSACLLTFGLPKEAYLGTSAAIALIVDATRLPFYLSEGFNTLPGESLLPISLSLVWVAFTGAWIGQRLVRRVRAESFHRFVLVMLGLMGCKLLVDGVRQLMMQAQ